VKALKQNLIFEVACGLARAKGRGLCRRICQIAFTSFTWACTGFCEKASLPWASDAINCSTFLDQHDSFHLHSLWALSRHALVSTADNASTMEGLCTTLMNQDQKVNPVSL